LTGEYAGSVLSSEINLKNADLVGCGV